MAKRAGRGPRRLVEPESLLGLNLGNVLLGLMEAGEAPEVREPGPIAPAGPHAGPLLLRLRMPDGSVEREEVLGGFLKRDRAGSFGSPRVVTLRGGLAALHKLYRVGGGVAAYAGALAAGGQRAFAAAAPGAAFRYRNAVLRRMTLEELAAALDPGLVYEFDLLSEER